MFFSLFFPIRRGVFLHILLFANVPASHLELHHKIVNNLSTFGFFFLCTVPSLVFFLRLTFSSSCELAGCWMQFQMSCMFQTTRKNVMRCTFFAGMLPFFCFVLPLWIHYVRFYRMANSRSLRWASNQTASRVIFIIGICRYWKKCSPKAKVLAVNHQTFDIRMM